MGHWTTDTIIHSMYHCTCICHRLRWPMGTSSSAAAGKTWRREINKKKRNSLTSSAVGASAALFDNDTFIFRRAVTLLRIRYASLRATSCFRTEVFPPRDNKKRYRMDRALPFPLIHDSFFKFQSLFAPVVKFTSAWSNPQRLTRIIIKGKHFFNVTTVFPSLPLPLRVPPDCSKTSYFSIQG